MQIEIQNPLNPGFYETVLDPKEQESFYLETYTENEKIDQYIEKNKLELEYDYKEYINTVSSQINDLFIEKINEAVENEFNIKNFFIKKIKEDVDSPKQYNYGNDRAFLTVEVEEKNYKKVIDLIFKKYHQELKNYIKERFTSRPGFSSFYDNNIEDWIDQKYDYDHNELQTIFEILIEDVSVYELDDISREVFQELDHWFEKPDSSKKLYYNDLKKLSENL